MRANKVSDFLGNTSGRFRQKSFSVSVVHYSEKVSEDWHYHENIHLSSVLVGGNRESRKSREIIAVPGKIMTYVEGEIHRNRNTAHPSLNLNIELFSEFFKNELRFSNLSCDHSSYLSLLKVYYELQINDCYTEESVQQIIESLFSIDRSKRSPDWIHTIKTLLNDRWDEFVALEEISKELGLHPVTISKGFAKHTGYTLADYMRSLKIKHAVFMILNSSLSLSHIAHACGFADQSHMYRLFKAYIGFNPKALKQVGSA